MNVEFGSDNHSGMHPNILNAIIKANKDYCISYGDDAYTLQAVRKLMEVFGSNISIYFVFTGTAANILSLKSMTHAYHSIICADTAHLNVHECNGPEKFTGCKITTVSTQNGKLTPSVLQPYLIGFGDVHMAQPKVISLTQSTEMGTTYSINELKKLCSFAHERGLLVHMDGARLCNAAVFLNKELKQITTEVGVDILSFGGTKNGMMIGEAVIFFDNNCGHAFEFYRKQGMQLASKMRFISAQFTAFFKNDLWKQNAKHANKMAQYLKNKITTMPEFTIAQEVEANMVFVEIPKKYMEKIRKKYYFHVSEKNENIARLVCSFNTTKNSIDIFINSLKQCL